MSYYIPLFYILKHCGKDKIGFKHPIPRSIYVLWALRSQINHNQWNYRKCYMFPLTGVWNYVICRHTSADYVKWAAKFGIVAEVFPHKCKRYYDRFFSKCKQLLSVDMKYVTFCQNVICLYFSVESNKRNIREFDSKSCFGCFWYPQLNSGEQPVCIFIKFS